MANTLKLPMDVAAGAASLLPPDDSDKFRSFAGVCIDRQDIPDTWRVEFILEKIGLQGSRLL